jgi:CRISPR-associated endonuclease/helicase Cas3
MIDRVFAKSNGESLPEHTEAVLRAAEAFLDAASQAALRQFGLEHHAQELPEALRRATVLHDLGKASEPFQRVLRCQLTADRLPVPHELVSVWLATTDPRLSNWLFSGTSSLAKIAALAAVSGHHFRIEQVRVDVRPGSGRRVRILAGHPDVAATLRLLEDVLGPVPVLEDRHLDLLAPGAGGIEQALLELQGCWQRFGADARRFVAVVKAMLAAADGQGSGWHGLAAERVRSALQRGLTAKELDKVIERALTDQRGSRVQPRDFQQTAAGARKRVVLIEAGCGAGKTAAAYLWARQVAVGRRLFVCYPTTGTATEGFRGSLHQVFAPQEDPALLLHSRVVVDLAELDQGADLDALDAADRDWALDTWVRPLVVCTADQVLGLVQNYRRPVYAVPVLALAAFVFDEIHLYDERMFGSLQRFLEAVPGAHVLLMTATLQPERRRAIQDMLGNELEYVPGPRELEELPRYQLLEAEEDRAWAAVAEAVGCGQPVLWIVNTVDRAVAIAERARRAFPDAIVLPYHSRFRYRDGARRRRELFDAFKRRGAVIAVTTQVCEVSLNLSADLMVTELCPVTSLIQRLGRLNRWARSGDPPRDALVIPPPRPEPYAPEALGQTTEWLRQHLNHYVSQADLSRSMPAGPMPARVVSAWLDGGAFTAPAPLREPGFTVEIVREEDVKAEWLEARRKWTPAEAAELQARSIPMLYQPVRDELPGWRRLRRYFVAPCGRVTYDKWSGARWT